MEKSDFLKLNPMLLYEVSKPFDNKDYIFELKFDGIRALIFINKGKIIIKSRRGIILNDIYPELLDIKNLSEDVCIFDGEIVLIKNGKPSFSKLQERMKLKNDVLISHMKENEPVVFVCFDILYKNKDLTTTKLIKRKEILNKFQDSNVFMKSLYVENNGIKLFDFVKKEGLEGIIAKKKASFYTYGKRTDAWLKIKNYRVEDFYVCGYIKNKNDTLSIILGELKNNKYYTVGKVLMGNKNPLYKKIIKENKVDNYLENYKELNSFFIKAKYKIAINYLERTKNNYLREPRIK